MCKIHLTPLLQVFLATCFDNAQLEQLKALEGQYVRLDRDPLGNVSATTMDISEGETACKVFFVLLSNTSVCIRAALRSDHAAQLSLGVPYIDASTGISTICQLSGVSE